MSRMPSMIRPLSFASALAGLALFAPGIAQAQQPTQPLPLPATPKAFEFDAREAFRIAAKEPEVAELTADRGQLSTRAEVRDDGRWQVGFFDGDEEVVQVHVDGVSGEVAEVWTGIQVAWTMARGYPEQFGHALNAPWVWIPMALVFFLGLLDWRKPLRIAHLDLLVLLSFGISHVFFNNADIGVSVPLAYPPLLYLLGRMLWVGFRGGGVGLRPSAPRMLLVIVCLFAIAFRITLNTVDSGVIDVGYAGVVGADRITDGDPIYGDGIFPEGVGQGDTYGPANYLAYVPFELALPWTGEWDSLPSAHAAAVFFDLATVLGLFVLGLRAGRASKRDPVAKKRLRAAFSHPLRALGNSQGQRLGLVLAFAWLTYPYTAFASQSNSNDSLVAAFLVWGLVALGSPLGRGLLVGLAAMVKFAPLALVPLYATGKRGLAGRFEGRRPIVPTLAAGAAALFAIALMLAHPAIDPGLATFYERTIESQLDR
ncbi:MAG: glycosyltransferase 87 family protein, partial [Solirubrobacterales bacterium]